MRLTTPPRCPNPPDHPLASVNQTLHKTVCPYCGVGCGMILHVADGRVERVSGDPEHPANFGQLCSKGSTVHQTIRSADRLTHAAQRRPGGGWDRVPLDVAMQATADRFSCDPVRARAGERRLLRLRPAIHRGAVRGEQTGQGLPAHQQHRQQLAPLHGQRRERLQAVARRGWAARALRGFRGGRCFLVMGSNMADTHPILSAAAPADACERRKVDRRRSAAHRDRRGNHALPPAAPGDGSRAAQRLAPSLRAQGRMDPEFIDRHTEGWDAMAEVIEAYPPARGPG